jgi:hypothetical protein
MFHCSDGFGKWNIVGVSKKKTSCHRIRIVDRTARASD